MYFFSPLQQKWHFMSKLCNSKSPGFYFSAVYSSKSYLSVLRTPLGVVRTKSQNNFLFMLNPRHVLVTYFFSLGTLCKPAPTDIPAFTFWYRSIPAYMWSLVGYTKSVLFFALLTSWPAVQKRSVFLQLCDQIQSSIHQIFTQMYSTVSIGPSHMSMVSAGQK